MTWGAANINTNGPAGFQVVPAWGDLYLDTAALLLQQTDNITLFAEGTGQKYQPGTAYGKLTSSSKSNPLGQPLNQDQGISFGTGIWWRLQG